MTPHITIAVTVSCLALFAPYAAGANEPGLARSPAIARGVTQFRAYYLSGGPDGNIALKSTAEIPPDALRAARDAQSLSPDGNWSDIDYVSSDPSTWPPARHCTRVLAMAAAAGYSGVKPDERDALLAAAHRALGYWVRHDFQCPNWWYNRIGVPKTLGAAALLLGDALTKEERYYVAGKVLPRGKSGGTGQNRVWMAGNGVMLGLLTGDEKEVQIGSAAIWEEVRVTTEEGIQPDFSFHQHGPQQQFGNYGLAFADDVCRWGAILRGTPWAMPEDRLATFRGYLLGGLNWVVWRGEMDVSACGRQLWPGSPAGKARAVGRIMRNAAVLDEVHAADYDAFSRRNDADAANDHAANDLVGDRYYWRSDYLVHRRLDSCVTLKMNSTRVVGSESLNHENLSGYHLADGTTYLYRRGDEYDDIFPAWDWDKLPGVTCAQTPGAARPAANEKGATDFIGAASDGAFGCAAMDFQRDGVAAHKAWFFGPDVTICLGSAIRSTGEASVATTINQCLLRGRVATSSAGSQAELAQGRHTLRNVDWIEHDGWRYAFPTPSSVRVDAGPRIGNWASVFTSAATPKDDIAKDVFTLWLDHGVKAADARYAYAVVPAGRELTCRVLANTPAMQAAALDDHRVAAVFWVAGKLDGEARLEVDRPCVLIFDASANRAVVADPTQKLTALTLTAGGYRRKIELPTGGDAGRSVTVSLDDKVHLK